MKNDAAYGVYSKTFFFCVLALLVPLFGCWKKALFFLRRFKRMTSLKREKQEDREKELLFFHKNILFIKLSDLLKMF